MNILQSLAFALCLTPQITAAFEFDSIDGGTVDLDDFRGNPVLIVNTASRCAFTPQYDGLQALYDTYRDQGLVVLAVPSNNFRQELATGEQVKEFCAVNFNLDIPMTMITEVKGNAAHPFYKWVRTETGFIPDWNFNKILLDPTGKVVGTYGSGTRPMGSKITKTVESLLKG